MTLEFEEKELELATNSKGDHPLDLFLKGDAETGGGVILNLPAPIRYRRLLSEGSFIPCDALIKAGKI